MCSMEGPHSEVSNSALLGRRLRKDEALIVDQVFKKVFGE